MFADVTAVDKIEPNRRTNIIKTEGETVTLSCSYESDSDMYVCTGTDNITMENLNIYYIKVLDQALQGTAPILDLCQVLLAFSLNSLLVV